MISKLILRNIKSIVKPLLQPRLPNSITRNFRKVDSASMEEIKTSLKLHYFSRPLAGGPLTGDAYLSTDEGKKDCLDHLTQRLVEFRQTVIPWLDATTPLKGANILEVGCGTGSSTVALAEQGAKVAAIDIDAESIQVAKDRCRVYGVEAEFNQINATEVYKVYKGKQFDFIIFFAALEHMVHEERLSAMNTTWNMLPKGGLWCVIDTPNRLWFLDGHTSWLPFYMWLPDDLAFRYSKFSKRQPFRDSYRELDDEAMISFLRHGRGVSYQEFDLAMKNSENLDVVSSLRIWRRGKNWLWNLGRRMTVDHRYESMLAKVGPKIHRGFYQSTLDLIIRKD